MELYLLRAVAVSGVFWSDCRNSASRQGPSVSHAEALQVLSAEPIAARDSTASNSSCNPRSIHVTYPLDNAQQDST